VRCGTLHHLCLRVRAAPGRVRQVDFVVVTEHRVVQEPAARIVRLGASDQPITPRSRSSARLSGLPLAATGTPGTAVIV
jgi:hypothetical protein